MPAVLRSTLIDEMTHGRLLNWGRWQWYNPTGGNVHPLARMMQQPMASRRAAPEENDAQLVEYILIACRFAGTYGRLNYDTLLNEYVFGRASIESRRNRLARKFGHPISRASYYDRLATARNWAADCLHMFATVDP